MTHQAHSHPGNSKHALRNTGIPSVKSSQLVAQPLFEYLPTQEAHHFTHRAFHGQVALLKTPPHSAGVPPCPWLCPLSHLLPLPGQATWAHTHQGSYSWFCPLRGATCITPPLPHSCSELHRTRAHMQEAPTSLSWLLFILCFGHTAFGLAHISQDWAYLRAFALTLGSIWKALIMTVSSHP